ncbi:MAG: hypothetical protein MJB57_05640 [Gemmatimonadetes bacterium]|nr:hypothetical protein [Gemmatimonadota bacterium]
MKKFVGVATAALLLVATAGPVSAQSLDEVLQNHYEAIGGLDAWKSLETMEASGSMSIMGGMAQGPFYIVQKRPSMSRMEIMFQGMEIIQAYDGTTAWHVVPPMGITTPQETDAATAAAMQEQADMDGPLIGFEEEGTTVELVGREMVGETETFKLAVTRENGNTSEYYLDASTYMPIKIVGTTPGMQATTTLGDYREVNGLLFPFSIDIENAQGPNALTFDEVMINVEVDESVFSMEGGS